jgi:branched-chain amino acid transport system ATP-binding protein
MEGLAPIIVQGLVAVIRRVVSESGLTVILVEQHARLALGLTANVIVLERGRIAHQGPSRALLEDRATLERLVSVA